MLLQAKECQQGSFEISDSDLGWTLTGCKIPASTPADSSQVKLVLRIVGGHNPVCVAVVVLRHVRLKRKKVQSITNMVSGPYLELGMDSIEYRPISN